MWTGKKITAGLFCFLVAFCPLVFSADETIPASPSSAVNEKAFDSRDRLRDPFSPVGFVPASMPGGASRPAGLERDKETTNQVFSLSGALRIGGVVRKGDKFYATINGFTVQAGEVISVVADGEVYKFVIEGIDFNKVQFKPVK